MHNIRHVVSINVPLFKLTRVDIEELSADASAWEAAERTWKINIHANTDVGPVAMSFDLRYDTMGFDINSEDDLDRSMLDAENFDVHIHDLMSLAGTWRGISAFTMRKTQINAVIDSLMKMVQEPVSSVMHDHNNINVMAHDIGEYVYNEFRPAMMSSTFTHVTHKQIKDIVNVLNMFVGKSWGIAPSTRMYLIIGFNDKWGDDDIEVVQDRLKDMGLPVVEYSMPPFMVRELKALNMHYKSAIIIA